MRNVRLGMIGLVALLVGLALSGCGGEGGGVGITANGIYIGQAFGDGSGPMRYFIGANGAFTGNVDLSPVCPGGVAITGNVDPVTGNVTFSGTACGITFTGAGSVQQTSPGVWTGSGTWNGSNGTSGTWSGTRTGATGSISL